MGFSVIVLMVVVTALVFDFTNGFHDTANAMATSIATGALRPKVAVVIAGVLNVVGAFLSIEVAKTISSGLVDEAKITPVVIFGGLIGAILWNLLTWLLGLPSSSSHALFGGLIGATWVAAGSSAIEFGSVISKVLLPAVFSPIIAGVAALAATYFAYRITAGTAKETIAHGFRLTQVVSASMVALAHGSNDGQKTMGVITLALITAGSLPASAGPPFWVIFSCGLTIGLGTSLGGWRIIQTLGRRVSDIQSPQGFAAETSSAAAILTSAHLGFALSTTHVCTGSIFGAGAGRRLASVRWGVAGQMALAWLLTLPSAAIVGALSAWVAGSGTLGTVLVALVALATATGIYALSRRRPITAENVNDVPAAARHRERLRPDPSTQRGGGNDEHRLGFLVDRFHRHVRRGRGRGSTGVLRVGRAVRSYRVPGRATRSCRCESRHGRWWALPAGSRRDHRLRCVHHRCLNRVSNGFSSLEGRSG